MIKGALIRVKGETRNKFTFSCFPQFGLRERYSLYVIKKRRRKHVKTSNLLEENF